MTLQDDYRVSLDAFEGPLDLLLFLVRRVEVDITDIPVAEITDQYLSFLHGVDDIDVEVAGEFLVMAATLIELKSRTLMPPEATDTERDGGSGKDALDPRTELIQQLLAYQRFRSASETLDERRLAHARRWPLRPVRHKTEPEEITLDLEDVHAMDLAETYERIMSSIDFTRLGDHVVEMDDTPIALHQEDLLDRLRRAPDHALTLQAAFDGRTPTQRVGLFLATLELARLRHVTVRQDEINAPIELELLEDDTMLVIDSDEISVAEDDDDVNEANEANDTEAELSPSSS